MHLVCGLRSSQLLLTNPTLCAWLVDISTVGPEGVILTSMILSDLQPGMELYANARAVTRNLSVSSQTDESVPKRRLGSSSIEY